jgi:Uma2 family endonuclease
MARAAHSDYPYELRVPIPVEAFTFEGFQRWAESAEFPASGRIDFLAGEVEVDMSPEDLASHAVVKVAISKTLQILVSEQDLGEVYSDSTRLAHSGAGLSTEPDVMVALWDTFDRGRVRYVLARQSSDLVPTLAGSPDLVVEIVSNSSVRKDTVVLPPLYARADIPERWLVDARRDLRFEVFTLKDGEYVAVAPEVDGWTASPVLGVRFRLLRLPTRRGNWRYILEHEKAGPQRRGGVGPPAR